MPPQSAARSAVLAPYSIEICLFLATWLVYVFHVVPAGGTNPNRYFDLTYSLVNYGSIQIDPYHENTLDKAFRDGHYYSGGLPGPSLVGVPAYLSFKLVYGLVPAGWLQSLPGTAPASESGLGALAQPDKVEFFLSTLWIQWLVLAPLSALGTVALYGLLLALGATKPASLLGALLYAFGTPVFYYSTTYYSHVFMATIVAGSLLCLVRLGPRPGGRSLAMLGFIGGVSVLMEYQGFFVAAGIGLYALYRWKSRGLALYALGVAIPLLALLSYNTAAFGGPFHVPQENLVGAPRVEVHGKGLMGFTGTTLERVLGLTVLPERGLFAYSPILLLAPVGWIGALRRRDPVSKGLALVSALVCVCLVLWVASYEGWPGGNAFGPRFLISLMPFMLIGVAGALALVPRQVWLPLGAVSIMTNWLGAQYGFADDVFRHWQTFFRQGFTLPALTVILGHAGEDSPAIALVRDWQWAIVLVYFVGIALALAALFRSVASKPNAQLALRPVGEHSVDD